MALPKLPFKLPVSLGGIEYPEDVRALGTAVMPKRLPFTLSALPEADEIPYGGIGWEVVVRQHDDFSSIILRTNDYIGLLFSDEEDSVGGGSATFDLDSQLFQKNLLNGRPSSDLWERENLWEAWFDGERRAAWLGTNVKETQLQDSEQRQVTVSGPGPAQVLEWAAVLPTSFPEVTPKLESFQDPISGDAVDPFLWDSISPGVTVGRGGGREEAQLQVDTFTQDRVLLAADVASLTDDVNSAIAYYNSIVKSSSYTQAEKNAALATYNQKRATLIKAQLAHGAKTDAINRAIAWRDSYPVTLDPNSMPTIRLSVPGEGQYRAITANPYDFKDSGVSAWIDPLPQLAGTPGRAITHFAVMADNYNFARLTVDMISGRRRLIAAVYNNNDIESHDVDYDAEVHRYWRIRESLGKAVFETSSDGTTWDELFRATYLWDPSATILQFFANLTGNVGINPPTSAYIGAINQNDLPASKPLFSTFSDYLLAAQGRGTIPYVRATWTTLKDSAGATWSSNPDASVDEGVDLLKLVQTFADAQQASWRMTPDFELVVRQKVWLAEEDDPTLQFHKEGQVVFHETGSQLFRELTRTREDVANYIVGRTSSGSYAVVEDNESMAKYQRREMYVSQGQTDDVTTTATLLGSTLESVKEEKNSWRIKVEPDQPGRRVFVDYGVGDWIGIENPETGNIDAWKVVGIAISVDEEGFSDLELTLQSRLELLAERLKYQIEKLGGSSNSAGIAISNPVTAATLIQQAKLSSLLDVVLGTPNDGDVLTYNKDGNFWSPVQPGDKTVPGTPVITDTYSNTYQSGGDVWTKAQIQVDWETPLNEDGSTISDGHHFEIRFRPAETSPYIAEWTTASQLTWSEAQAWSQPTIPEITNDGWQTLYAGWDDNTALIQELTPGVTYELQIRAVDSSTPQHWSGWSDVVTVTAAQDAIAPPMPAPPLVASSRLAIQVTHSLGKFTGGEFNLPEDLDHLEIHVGGPEFFPDETTRVGKVPANLSMMRGRIPAIQTVQVENTDNVWVSVVAVDRTGNRSAGSPPVTASVNLIDDAHISDLTATKITAGTISSAIVLAGIIRTAESGARAEMDSQGFRIYTNDDDPTVSLVGSPGTLGNFLLIKDPENSKRTLAGIDGSGRGSFQNLYVVDDINLGGASLMNDIIIPRAKGVIALGTYQGDPIVGAGPSVDRGFLEISFIAEESRSYMVSFITDWNSTAGEDRMIFRLRDGGANAPTVSLPWLQHTVSRGGVTAGNVTQGILTWAGTFTPGLHRLLITFQGILGNGTVQASGGNTTTVFWVEDIGLPVTDTLILNDAGIAQYNAPAPVAGDAVVAKPTAKVTYTKEYTATWSGSYRSNGAYSPSHGATMTQGNSGDGWLGDARGLVGFNDAQIRKDLAGATIKSCYITLYANHWWENNGGTARIGTHKYSSRPSSITSGSLNPQRVSSGSWPKPGKRKVSLGTTIGNEFKSGAARGIMVGPTNDTHDQYGKFNGNGQSNEPVLTIVYVK